MKLPKLRELKEALKALFSGRYTSRFPAEPAPAAPGFRGKPLPREEWCIGCQACMEACPSSAIEIKDNLGKKKRTLIRYWDRCNYCGQCQDKCPQPQPGVELTPEYDYPGYDLTEMKITQEFELIICEKCKSPLGTQMQLEATVKRMGPALAHSSPDMLNTRQLQTGRPLPSPSKRKHYTRADIFTFLCPVCRHEVFKKEAGN